MDFNYTNEQLITQLRNFPQLSAYLKPYVGRIVNDIKYGDLCCELGNGFSEQLCPKKPRVILYDGECVTFKNDGDTTFIDFRRDDFNNGISLAVDMSYTNKGEFVLEVRGPSSHGKLGFAKKLSYCGMIDTFLRKELEKFSALFQVPISIKWLQKEYNPLGNFHVSNNLVVETVVGDKHTIVRFYHTKMRDNQDLEWFASFSKREDTANYHFNYDEKEHPELFNEAIEYAKEFFGEDVINKPRLLYVGSTVSGKITNDGVKTVSLDDAEGFNKVVIDGTDVYIKTQARGDSGPIITVDIFVKEDDYNYHIASYSNQHRKNGDFVRVWTNDYWKKWVKYFGTNKTLMKRLDEHGVAV